MIGLISTGPPGSPACDALAAALPDHTRIAGSPGPLAGGSPEQVFDACGEFVSFMDETATLRLLLPLLGRRTVAPAVVRADEQSLRTAVLLEGPGNAGERLARAVAAALPGFAPPHEASRAGDTGVPVLDSLGWPVEGAVPAVARALLEGAPLAVCNTVGWPLPALPPAAQRVPGMPGEKGTAGLWVTDQVVPLGAAEAVLRPPSLTVGVGACRGTAGAEVVELVEQALDDEGLSPGSVTGLATVDVKAHEPGLLAAARRFGVALHAYPAAALGGMQVPHPTDSSRTAVGTPSVAEAAALLAAGKGGELLLPKVKSAPVDGGPPRATAAVARRRPLLPAPG